MSQPLDKKLDFYKLLPRFKSLEIEQEFRSSFLEQDKFLSRNIFIGAILVSIISIIPDSLSKASNESLHGLYISTFVFLLFSIIILKALASAPRYRQLDLITTFWWLGVITAVTVGNTLYPPDLIIHVVFDIMIPVAIYLLIPIGLMSQFLLALLFTIANLGILFTLKENLVTTDIAFILLAYTTVHFLGLLACWQSHIGRRNQFTEQKKEQLLKIELQKMLDELQILRGIIPICAYCKQIRDDEGFWHQVEVYIKKHSEAEFTHGICPGCIEKHFPNEYKKLMEKESASESK